jgi:hypothetical protein
MNYPMMREIIEKIRHNIGSMLCLENAEEQIKNMMEIVDLVLEEPEPDKALEDLFYELDNYNLVNWYDFDEEDCFLRMDHHGKLNCMPMAAAEMTIYFDSQGTVERMAIGDDELEDYLAKASKVVGQTLTEANLE